MKKLLAVIFALLTLMSAMSLTCYAAVSYDDEIAPCYNNTMTASTVLVINTSGRATVSLTCTGIGGVTSKIVAETKLERKWGLLWLDVTEWTDTVNGVTLAKVHYQQLEKNGKYRAKTTYTVSGSGGSADVIVATGQDTY